MNYQIPSGATIFAYFGHTPKVFKLIEANPNEYKIVDHTGRLWTRGLTSVKTDAGWISYADLERLVGVGVTLVRIEWDE